MKEYYTIKECFDVCGDDDTPYIEDGFNSGDMYPKRIILDDPLDFCPDIDSARSDKWQIKRAPKSAFQEWNDKTEWRCNIAILSSDENGYGDIDELVKRSRKQGYNFALYTLKKWLINKNHPNYQNCITDKIKELRED